MVNITEIIFKNSAVLTLDPDPFKIKSKNKAIPYLKQMDVLSGGLILKNLGLESDPDLDSSRINKTRV